MTTLLSKLNVLTDDQLTQLSLELRSTTVPENALIREVIKDTEFTTLLPVLAFVSVGQTLAHVLADRLIIANERIERLENRVEDIIAQQYRTASDL